MHASNYARLRIQGETVPGKKVPVIEHIDVKVFSVYEGTNAIQSLDLLMRKIMMNKDMRNYKAFKNRVTATMAKAKGIVEDKYIDMVGKGIAKVDELITMMGTQLMSKKIGQVLANATVFQQSMHMMVLAWLHLESLTITVPKSKELTGDLKGADSAKLLEGNDEAACMEMNAPAPLFALSATFTGSLKE